MNNQDNFYIMVGSLIMFCQCIEHDIKFIYAGMPKGKFEENYKFVEAKTLGTIVKMLKELDNSDGEPYFDIQDYELFEQITKIRNYWAHQGYIDYIYNEGKLYDMAFDKQYKRLLNDYNRLKKIYKITEKVRVDYFS